MSYKPFACKHDGCTETFANEDHCMVHQKRHEMILNVGLANKNQPFADQTPTPTRFIRNCEEVGLFQDLQNVNPFDETFKKAIDHSKTSSEAPFIANNMSDDTLHTPHIFPHIQAALTKTNISNDISNSISADLESSSPLDRSDSPLDRSDSLIIIDDSDEEIDQIIVDINQSNLKALPETKEATGCLEESPILNGCSEESPILNGCSEESPILNGCLEKSPILNVQTVSPTNIVEKISLKEILREKLQTRNNGVNENNDSSSSIIIPDINNPSTEKATPYPICLSQVPRNNILTDTYKETLMMHKLPRKRRCIFPKATNESIVSSSTESSFLDDAEPDEELVLCSKDADRKLRNRVAQSRSRLRKKMYHDVISDQLNKLQSQTDDLKYENKALKKQIHELKKYILTHHQKCAFTGDMVFLKTCLAEEVVKKPEFQPTDVKQRKLLPVLPKSSPTLTPLPLRIQPSRPSMPSLPPSTNPIILAVPPVKNPAKGNVNYIVIAPPPPPPLHVNT